MRNNIYFKPVLEIRIRSERLTDVGRYTYERYSEIMEEVLHEFW